MVEVAAAASAAKVAKVVTMAMVAMAMAAMIAASGRCGQEMGRARRASRYKPLILRVQRVGFDSLRGGRHCS